MDVIFAALSWFEFVWKAAKHTKESHEDPYVRLNLEKFHWPLAAGRWGGDVVWRHMVTLDQWTSLIGTSMDVPEQSNHSLYVNTFSRQYSNPIDTVEEANKKLEPKHNTTAPVPLMEYIIWSDNLGGTRSIGIDSSFPELKREVSKTAYSRCVGVDTFLIIGRGQYEPLSAVDQISLTWGKRVKL